MNTFFRKQKNTKWTWRSSNGETKNEIDFILRAHPGIVLHVEVIGKVPCSDHRTARSRVRLDLRRERKKLAGKKSIAELAVRGKLEEFRTSLQNRYSAPAEEADLSVQAISDKLTSIITECPTEVGGKIVRLDTGKHSEEARGLIKESQGMNAPNPTNKIEQAELSKLIKRRKVP